MEAQRTRQQPSFVDHKVYVINKHFSVMLRITCSIPRSHCWDQKVSRSSFLHENFIFWRRQRIGPLRLGKGKDLRECYFCCHRRRCPWGPFRSLWIGKWCHLYHRQEMKTNVSLMALLTTRGGSDVGAIDWERMCLWTPQIEYQETKKSSNLLFQSISISALGVE